MIQIDPEFQALIPPLAPEERQQLEANILADGCRDPLVIWNVPAPKQGTHKCYGDEQAKCNLEPGFEVWHCTHCDHNPATIETLLIDGHNRYEICTKNGIGFETVERDFADRSEAIEWIIRNQFGRRNLTAYVRTQLALRLKETIAKRAKANQVAGGGGGKAGCQKSGKVVDAIDTKKEVAKIASVSHDTVAKVMVIEQKAAPEVKQKLSTGEVSINQAYQEIKKEEKKTKREADIQSQREAIEAGSIESTDGFFDVIAMDPPWNYGREYDPDGSRVANPYPEMTQTQLLELRPPFADDCVLFLWTTHAFMFDAKELLDSWGFTYKACLVWDKEKIGMGAWLRMQCEFCLVGIKGKPYWNNTTYRDVIREPRREHSRKPDAFYKLVEDVTAGRRLEFFSRERREGWEVFGNDTEKF
jgi:N6-adenosine-specific RNA methylase IME4